MKISFLGSASPDGPVPRDGGPAAPLPATQALLASLAPGERCTVLHVGGGRGFRRRLMELGLLPGTRIELVSVAPLGDPLELLVRGCSLSIRRSEALCVRVEREGGGCATSGCGSCACHAATS